METAPAQGEEARERGTRPARTDPAPDTTHPATDPPKPSGTDPRGTDAAPDAGEPRPRPEGVPAGPRWWRWWG
ncbi:hypothetical protein CTKZ_07810 [Cellulomonas algicola]|uniref:Uncharacterized protein n=1 Tax=Cellulomonas algicola TaxID=2071633 RepID=A0A401UX20_9CELL|nr:hypothetical protein CTKZ_07810 [Cellulomonas algicola]